MMKSLFRFSVVSLLCALLLLPIGRLAVPAFASGEIYTNYSTGSNLYALVLNGNAQVWNNNTVAFETLTLANYTNYAVALTESPVLGIYIANFPIAINTLGSYKVYIYLRNGGANANGDTLIDRMQIDWSGSTLWTNAQIPANVWTNATRALTDKANFSLSQAFPTNFASLAIANGGAVTVGTNNDKTGYSLTQAFPTNFAALGITGGGAVTIGTNNDKTGYSLSQAFPANFAALAITNGGAVTVGTNNDKTGYALTQAFPTNFAALGITGGGAVTVGTNNDKTGYSLSQAFPTNFSALSITGGGSVTAGTVSDKTGYSLTQAFPTNFAALAINGGGGVTVGANVDSSGVTTLLSRLGTPTGASIAADIQTRATPGQILSNPSNLLVTDASGNVALSAATQQSIANTLLATPVDGLSLKNLWYVSFMQAGGKFGTATRATAAPWTISVPLLRADGTTTAWTYVTTYTDSSFTKTSGRTYIIGTMP
jgi:hypothetical protein